MLLRLCLKDKSSVLVEGNIEDIQSHLNTKLFIKVVNHNTKKEELYNTDNIWCVRQSSQK